MAHHPAHVTHSRIASLAYPAPSSPAASAAMRGNRRRDTRPERALRTRLHAQGYRFRVDYPVLLSEGRCRVDIAFTRHRVAVQVDGCFWHGCPDHGSKPQANSTYWQAKLERNRARDERDNHLLRSGGWRVLRVWEHEQPDAAMRRVVVELEKQWTAAPGRDGCRSGPAT